MQKKSGDIDKKLWQNWSHSGKISDFFARNFSFFLKIQRSEYQFFTLIQFTLSPSNPTSTINSYLSIYGSIYLNFKNRSNVVDLVNIINTVQN